MTASSRLLVSVVGPTAVGKTSLAVHLAKRFQTEIVSADSRQFFRELLIGTAKPTAKELQQVPHHFINSHSINSSFSAGQYGREAMKCIEQLHQSHQLVIAVGGSSLYLKSLWEGFDEMPEVPGSFRERLNNELAEVGLEPLLDELYTSDPDYYKQVDRKNPQRVIRALEVVRFTGAPFSSFRKAKQSITPYQNLKIGLTMDREQLFDRINQRMDQMIAEGLFEEVRSLAAYRDLNALQTVVYTDIFGFLDGKYDKAEAIRLLKRNSRRYAKRQVTWFKRYEDIHWFQPGDETEIEKLIKSRLS